MSLVVFCLVMMAVLVSPAKAATLVNDFSGAVSGYGFTDPLAAFYAMSSPSASPTATGNAGQVDVGYYTVNYRDMPNFSTGAFSTVNGFSGDLGTWNGSTGFYEGEPTLIWLASPVFTFLSEKKISTQPEPSTSIF